LGIRFLRKLQMATLKPGIELVKGRLPIEVADYLLNRKRKEILDLEMRRQVSIQIVGDSSLTPGDSKIESIPTKTG